MTKDKGYRSIAELTASISARMSEVNHGHCTLAELDELLSDIRELEERIVIIRYKGMERIKYSKVKKPKGLKAHAPELPLDEVTEMEEKAEAVETSDEEVNPNQISLIDSIEEISKESSINEQMKSVKSRSLAQKMESIPVESITKALNLNLKMGLVKNLFEGDEARFNDVMSKIDESGSVEGADGLLKEEFPDEELHEGKLLRKLKKLIERRFL